MISSETRSIEANEPVADAPRPVPAAMQMAWAASFLLWRSYYFLTVVVIPSMGWR
jgi:hypothetical protein